MIKKCVLACLILASLSFGYSAIPELPEGACPDVTNCHETAKGSGSITFGWTCPGSAVTQYKVWYKRHSDNYTSSFVYTTNTSISYSGLTAGSYTFYFTSICDTESSNVIGIDDEINL